MNRKIKISVILLLIILLIIPIININTAFATSNNSAEIVIDSYSGRILYEKNSDKKMYMASTTKILTALCIIENCNLNDVVAVTKKTVGIEGSSIYLKAGEKLTVKELLFGLMLRSGNDCAETLAIFCSDSIEKFALLMNETAQKIGAKNSNFVNPHGLHDENHYTTAYDLAIISAYAMKNKDFREIVGTKRVKISNSLENYERVLINKNKMLNEYDGATGIKTGYTKKAGRCLVSSAIKEGREFIVVVLNCPPMFEQSKKLLDTCFEEFTNVKVIENDNIVGFITDCKGKKFSLTVKNDVILPLKKEEQDKIKIEYYYKNESKNELSIDEIVGEIKIYCENNLIFTEKIYTI